MPVSDYKKFIIVVFMADTINRYNMFDSDIITEKILGEKCLLVVGTYDLENIDKEM